MSTTRPGPARPAGPHEIRDAHGMMTYPINYLQVKSRRHWGALCSCFLERKPERFLSLTLSTIDRARIENIVMPRIYRMSVTAVLHVTLNPNPYVGLAYPCQKGRVRRVDHM